MSCSGTKRVSIQHHERMGHIDDRCSRRRHRYHNPPSALQIVGGTRSNGLAGRLRGNAGVVTEAVLKVTSAPVNLHVAVATFQNLRAAVETANCLIGDNPPVDALELLGQYSMRAINLYGLSHRRWSERPTFFLKFSDSLYAVADQVRRARIAATKNQCETYELLAEEEGLKPHGA